ncbi:MAG: prevent-host-death protein [Cyanophyceae cyanobacterium]
MKQENTTASNRGDEQLPESSLSSRNNQLRPFGLCKGEFVVPDDFDDPLPEEILKMFEGE